jgi:hypothetical protein
VYYACEPHPITALCVITFKMSMRRVLALAAVLAALGPGAAHASVRADDLWATVNVCDTARHPNEVGIRASMPAAPRRAWLAMRFRVQYREDDRWRTVAGAESGWRSLGRARGGTVESGWSVEFADRQQPVTLRGVVSFRWRRGERTIRRARRITEAGHKSTAGADPPDYSAAACTIR